MVLQNKLSALLEHLLLLELRLAQSVLPEATQVLVEAQAARLVAMTQATLLLELRLA